MKTKYLSLLMTLIIPATLWAQGSESTAKKRITPKLDAEITEMGDQAVLSNINFQTTPERQRSLVLGVGFYVADSALVTQPAEQSICKQFGYTEAESANWETNAVTDDELVYLADPKTLKMRMTFGKDLPRRDDTRKVKHLTSVICRT